MSAITTWAPSSTKARAIAGALSLRAAGDDGALAGRVGSCERPSSQTVELHDRVGGEADGGVAVGEVAAELLVEVLEVPESSPAASKRCSTTGAASRATMPPYTTKTWPVIRAAAGEAR